MRRGDPVCDVLEVVTCVDFIVGNWVRFVSLLVLVQCPVCRGKWKSLTGVPRKLIRVTQECWVETLEVLVVVWLFAGMALSEGLEDSNRRGIFTVEWRTPDRVEDHPVGNDGRGKGVVDPSMLLRLQ